MTERPRRTLDSKHADARSTIASIVCSLPRRSCASATPAVSASARGALARSRPLSAAAGPRACSRGASGAPRAGLPSSEPRGSREWSAGSPRARGARAGVRDARRASRRGAAGRRAAPCPAHGYGNRRHRTNPTCGRYKSATRRAFAANWSSEVASLRRGAWGLKILVSAVQFRPRTLSRAASLRSDLRNRTGKRVREIDAGRVDGEAARVVRVGVVGIRHPHQLRRRLAAQRNPGER